MPSQRTRITAGTHRGRIIKTPPGRLIRPTTALVREALFNIIGVSIRGARILDLFAGSGTIGMEALSRGADHVTFVDRQRTCANIVTENLTLTGFAERADVASADATDWVKAHQGDLRGYNLIVLDPPYHDPVLDRTLQLLDDAPLREQALIVIEQHRAHALPALRRLQLLRTRDYGTTRLSFLRAP
jgi:16S rRNA (guanine966-N2)-methyltransferase